MKKIKQLIWPLIMALYGLAILILMITGELKSYIHPKLHILSFLAMIILFILSVATAKENISKNRNPALKATYIVFIIPLMLFFVGTDADASRQVAVENGLKISAVPSTVQEEEENNDQQVVDIPEDVSEDVSEDVPEDVPVDTPAVVEEASSDPLNDDTLYLTDVNFTALMDEMHVNLSDYKGRQISYLGLIYKQEDFEENELVVGRLLMYCCAADAQIMGLLGHSALAADYEDGDWVTIRGYVDEKAYEDPYSGYEASIPYIVIEEITPAEEPDDPYVYFNE